ncbi:MAG: hypothetical protein ACFFCS_13225, partial [Candidatus Hodarchaeota archaeon]
MYDKLQSIDPKDLKRILMILDKMEPLLDELREMEKEVVDILKPKLLNPITGKKIRIPSVVKFLPSGRADGIWTFRFWSIRMRREWIK